MDIKEAIATINRMRADGIIERYAIGGAVGATFYPGQPDVARLFFCICGLMIRFTTKARRHKERTHVPFPLPALCVFVSLWFHPQK